MNKKLRIGFSLGLGLLVVNACLPIAFSHRVSDQSLLANEVREATANLYALLSAYKDTETGERGFILSGRPIFLEPYVSGRQEVARLMSEIDDSLRGVLAQPREIAPLHELDRQISAFQETQIAKRREGRVETGEEAEQGKALMDAVRRQVAAIGSKARAQANIASARAQSLQSRSRWLIAITTLLDILLFSVTYHLARRLLASERDANEAMARAGHHIMEEGRLRLHMLHKLEEQTEKLNKIIDTQTALGSATLRLEDLLPLVVERILQITPASGAVIEMLEGDELVYQAASGAVSQHVGLRLQRGSSLSGRCIAEQAVMISEDAYHDPRVNNEAARKIGSASMIVAPLFRTGEAVGVLKIIGPVAHAFDENDVQTLRLVTGLLGSAMGNCMAFETTQALLAARSEALIALGRQQQLLGDITDQIPGLVAFVDGDMRYRYSNNHYVELLGSKPSEGQSMEDFLGEQGLRNISNFVRTALSGERVEYEHTIATRLGPRHIQGHFIPQHDEDGTVTGFCIIGWDIHSLKEREAKWQSRALVDQLTGAYNRFCFVEMLEQLMQRRRSRSAIAVLYLDIDHFKRINDTYGHATGDAMLKEFAQALRRGLRASDVMGRMGGDEFCVMLDRIGSTENAGRVAQKIIDEVAAIHLKNEHLPAVTTSIGVAFFEHGTSHAEALIASADAALYQAKQAGRNGFALVRGDTAQASA